MTLLWMRAGGDLLPQQTSSLCLKTKRIPPRFQILVHRETEREFIGTNIKQFHAKIKLRRWDTEKKLQNRLSRRAPLERFINFYRGLKLMAELVRI